MLGFACRAKYCNHSGNSSEFMNAKAPVGDLEKDQRPSAIVYVVTAGFI
jgi:hypothetical protein